MPGLRLVELNIDAWIEEGAPRQRDKCSPPVHFGCIEVSPCSRDAHNMPTKPLLARVTDCAWSVVTFAGRLEPLSATLHGPSQSQLTLSVEILSFQD